MARSLQHTFDVLRQRVRVVRLEPLLQAELVLVAHVDVHHLLPLVVAHDLARHGGPAPEVVGGVQHLQRARIALVHQAFDVAGVELARGQFLGQELRRAFHAPAAPIPGCAQVADVELRRLAVQVAHGQADAAQVLERVVGGEHAVGVGRAREHGALGAAQVLGIQVERLAVLALEAAALQAAPGGFIGAVGKLHAREVQLRELAVALLLALPGVGGERGVVQAGAVPARFGRVDARFRCRLCGLVGKALGAQARGDGAGVGRHGVGLLTIARGAGGQLRGLGEDLHGVGEVVAVQAGGRQHHVHARAAQLFARHQAHAGDAPARIPHRFHAQQPQRLRFQQALVAHGFH